MKLGLKAVSTILLCLVVLIAGYNLYLQISISREADRLQDPELIEKSLAFEHEGRPPAFLLIHGFSNSPFDMRPVAERLERLGYAYRAIQLPGHGISARNLRAATMEHWLTAARDSYAGLRQRYGRVGIIGFSMGADLGLLLASRHEVDVLVLISPFLGFSQAMPLASHLESICRFSQWIIPYVKKIRLGMIKDPRGLKQYFAYWHMPLKAIIEVVEVGRMAVRSARSVSCNTMWAHSRRDSVASFSASLEAFRGMPAQYKKFLAYDQSDHTILYDYESGDLLENVCAFIRAHEQPSQ